MANVTEVAAESTATNAGAGAGTGTGTNAKEINPNRRRIIKASPPPKLSVDDEVVGGMDGGGVYPSPKNGVSILQSPKKDDIIEKKKKHISVSSVVDQQETVEKWREDRFKATEKRGKSLREKEMKERRKSNAINETANATPNPFSRFLSVFSVEPEFPEHKRPLEAAASGNDGIGEDEAAKEPVEKRLKPSSSESCDSSYGGGAASVVEGNNPKDGLFSSKTFWVTAAVAVAVGVALALQRGRNK